MTPRTSFSAPTGPAVNRDKHTGRGRGFSNPRQRQAFGAQSQTIPVADFSTRPGLLVAPGLRGAGGTRRRVCRSYFQVALTGQRWAKMGHRSYPRIVSRYAVVKFAGDPPGRDHDRQRDSQQGQNIPEGDHHDDAGEDPEHGGLRVVGAMVSLIVMCRMSASLRLVPPSDTGPSVGTPERWKDCPIWGDGDPFHWVDHQTKILGYRRPLRTVAVFPNGPLRPAQEWHRSWGGDVPATK